MRAFKSMRPAPCARQTARQTALRTARTCLHAHWAQAARARVHRTWRTCAHVRASSGRSSAHCSSAHLMGYLKPATAACTAPCCTGVPRPEPATVRTSKCRTAVQRGVATREPTALVAHCRVPS